MTYRGRCGGRKARLQARKEAAILKAAKPHVAKAWEEAWDKGARRMQEDMFKGIVEQETQTNYRTGGLTLTRVLTFPDARERPFFKARLEPPMGQYFGLSSAQKAIMHDYKYREILFRPITNECSIREGENEGRLRWYTWEPDSLGDDQVERTKVLYQSLGKLSRVRAMLGYCGSQFGGVYEAEKMLDECLGDLRRVLGKFESRPTREDRDLKDDLLYRTGIQV